MRQLLILPDDISMIIPEQQSMRKKEIVYGLIILIILADTFYREECYLENISEKGGFPLPELKAIVIKLEKAGLIECYPEDRNRLLLKDAPERNWILKIIPILKEVFTDK